MVEHGHVGRRGIARGSPVETELPQARQGDLERDPGLQPGQRVAQAAVQALAEAEVARGRTERVVLVGVLELTLVVVGGADHHRHPVAGRDPHAADLHVAGQVPHGELERGAEAQPLLDGAGDQRRVLAQRPLLVGPRRELLEERGQQARCGLDAGEVEPEDQADDLGGRLDVVLGERHARDVGLHDVGEQVGARPPAPLLQQPGQVDPRPVGALHGVRGEPVVVGHPVLEPVGPRDQLVALLAEREAEEVEEDRVGQRPGELLREVDRAALREGVDQSGGQPTYVGLELGDAARHELPLHHRPQLVVPRVVDDRQVAGAALVVGGVEVDAGVVDERHRVQQRGPDVVVARERPEVPLLVVVDRRLVAQPLVDREGVLLEGHRERVVDDRRPGLDRLSGRDGLVRHGHGVLRDGGVGSEGWADRVDQETVKAVRKRSSARSESPEAKASIATTPS